MRAGDKVIVERAAYSGYKVTLETLEGRRTSWIGEADSSIVTLVNLVFKVERDELSDIPSDIESSRKADDSKSPEHIQRQAS